MCFSVGTPKIINFPLVPNGKLIIFKCPKIWAHYSLTIIDLAGPCSAVSNESDSRARGHRFDTQSRHMLSYLLLLIQEGQLSVTGESLCMKYWLTA